MISVIMPTMWKGDHWKKMIPLLDVNPLIGEIIIVDNDQNNNFMFKQHLYNKIKHLKSDVNLFVNPSWNLGVSISKFENICLLSDDVFFDINCLNSVFEKITPENGLIGFSSSSIFVNEESIFFSEWEQKTINPINHIHHKFGICMFLHKSNYRTIPENLKIFYGDTFLFSQNIKRRKQNWQIENYFAVTAMGTTSKSDEFKGFFAEEKENFIKL